MGVTCFVLFPSLLFCVPLIKLFFILTSQVFLLFFFLCSSPGAGRGKRVVQLPSRVYPQQLFILSHRYKYILKSWVLSIKRTLAIPNLWKDTCFQITLNIIFIFTNWRLDLRHLFSHLFNLIVMFLECCIS